MLVRNAEAPDRQQEGNLKSRQSEGPKGRVWGLQRGCKGCRVWGLQRGCKGGRTARGAFRMHAGAWGRSHGAVSVWRSPPTTCSPGCAALMLRELVAPAACEAIGSEVYAPLAGQVCRLCACSVRAKAQRGPQCTGSAAFES